jgi:hypothetical protein
VTCGKYRYDFGSRCLADHVSRHSEKETSNVADMQYKSGGLQRGLRLLYNSMTS